MSTQQRRPHHVLFVGEEPEGSAPTLTWARALSGEGAQYRFVPDLGAITIANWFDAVRWSDAIVFQDYEGPCDYVIRQLALAVAAGRPLIRKWSGTDVMRCVQNVEFRRQARTLDRVASLNLTSEAKYTQAELESAGFSVMRILPILAATTAFHVAEQKPLALLAYLPDMRPSFYGAQQVRYAAERNPDIQFIVVADNEHALVDLPNVESLGWVDDMEAIWSRVGGVIRLTIHDGLPRMVVEALARGKYVLFSYPLEGCWHVTDTTTLNVAIEAFKRERTINQPGIEAAKRLLQPNNHQRLLEILVDASIRPSLTDRANAFALAVILTMRLKLSRSGGSAR